MNAACRLVVLRHGASTAGHSLLLGHSDYPLSPSGLAATQHSLTQICQAGPVDAVISSPLQRCAHFVPHATALLQCPSRIDPAWAEMHFGDWDGQPLDVLQHQPDWQRWRADPERFTPPGAEPYPVFRQRIQAATAPLYQPGQRLLLLSHAGAARALLADLLHLSWAQAGQLALSAAGWLEFSLLPDQPAYLLHLQQGMTP
ncbi:histidine phosphatase family protein [Leeia aquatica]|uniref:Histidine phosphatase family protein n=1 Tax=Leeia aquatica TaxID=2725557 RepID=A0A847SDL6_9NEIS|nr:histidine phosphatase family protein [Leeia aquatica]NLR75268.1 histidine phosphatase family protein [Leeia aquatica]